ncbi:MAG: DUF5067 domain-containing protein [Atopobiaceae bacterium]|nr:DUF5067 domain-containing protein [Atopobiaceae bacterium]
MKKILDMAKNVALVLVVLVVIAMFAGGGGSSDKSSSKTEKESTEQTEQASKEKEKKEEAPAEEEPAEEADDGPTFVKDSKYEVSIDNWRLTENYDGSPCIAIDYTFTNVSDDNPTSMQMASSITVYQSGVECEDAWLADDNSDGYTNKVKSGVSVNVTRVYKLQNTTDDVEVEVAPLFSWNDDLLAYTTIHIS